jgi:peptidoglycan lytic transglycosylase
MIAPNSFSRSRAAKSNSSRINRVTPGKTFIGKATIYPNRLNGHKTASGETFRQSDHTAASNKLPLGTEVKVTSLRTGKSTNVTLIDRGPALGGHKIDLSKKAAREIGLTRKEGTVPVKIKVTRTLDGHETRAGPIARQHWRLTPRPHPLKCCRRYPRSATRQLPLR